MTGYPEELIGRLQPKSIVLSHFNDFFAERADRRLLPTAELTAFLGKCQRAASYPGLERILIPDLDSTLAFGP